MNTKQRIYPQCGTVYTLEYIINTLYLRDSECLLFQYNGVVCVIQNSHLSSEELLSIPGIAKSKWEYQYETNEWIPVFYYADSIPITKFVDIELDTDPYRRSEIEYWVTPKGFPREQYKYSNAIQFNQKESIMSQSHRYQKLFNLFTTASSHLKYPKITFKTETGVTIQLYLATKGYIAIKANGEYVGKIQPYQAVDGMQYSFRMYTGTTEEQKEIESFCANPLESAVIKGQAYSHCCFCGLELTNKASLQMGYGPICAENYGLPWFHTDESNKLIDL